MANHKKRKEINIDKRVERHMWVIANAFSFSHIKNINLATNHCFFCVLFCAEKRGRYMTQNFCNFCHVAFKSLKTILHYWIYEKVHNSSKRQIWLLNILNREFENKEREKGELSKHSKLNWIWSLSKKTLGKASLEKRGNWSMSNQQQRILMSIELGASHQTL